jgi:hypothetical protein
MNIFVLDKDPVAAAQSMCNLHINKMVLESAQMLTNCFLNNDLETAPQTYSGTVRKYSHWNHPSSVWTRDTSGNMLWLLEHTIALEQERLFRGYNPHFVSSFIEWVSNNHGKAQVSTGNLTEFPIAISAAQNCRHHPAFESSSVVEKYRLYYICDKAAFAKWTRREVPEWFSKGKADLQTLVD